MPESSRHMESNRRPALALQAGLVSSWRELTFWILLLCSFHGLSSTHAAAQAFGLAQTAAFLIFSMRVTGRLHHLGLRLACWNPISKTAILHSVATGLVAGAGIVVVAWVGAEPLGTDRHWPMQVAALTVGPVLEEVVFRGYLLSLSFALWPYRHTDRVGFAAVGFVAFLFAAAHAERNGITHTQLSCILLTGMLYGGLRVRYESTVAAVLAHATYNTTLYIAAWTS